MDIVEVPYIIIKKQQHMTLNTPAFVSNTPYID